MSARTKMIRYIAGDLKRTLFLEGVAAASFAQKIFTLFFAYGFHALIVYRMGQAIRFYLSRWYGLPLYYPVIFIYHCLRFSVRILYGIHIDPDAVIGERFYIGHFGKIVIGPKVVIGHDCSIHQQVSIGVFPKDQKGCVVIEDNVWIGGHSLIKKGVVIGKNATIVVGANVVSNVKPFTMVMGNPARMIKQDFDNSSLMGY